MRVVEIFFIVKSQLSVNLILNYIAGEVYYLNRFQNNGLELEMEDKWLEI